MSYRSDKLVIDGHTDTHTHTQATTIPEGQNWLRVIKSVIAIKYVQVLVTRDWNLGISDDPNMFNKITRKLLKKSSVYTNIMHF